MQTTDRRENHFPLYRSHQVSSRGLKFLLYEWIEGSGPAWPRCMFCGAPSFRFRRVNHPDFVLRIFLHWRWQYFYQGRFYQYPEVQQNKGLGSSYLLSILTQPGIQEFFL